LCLCSRLLTDGRVTETHLRKLLPVVGVPSVTKYVTELVTVRLWSAHPKGGWRIKDFLEYNPSSIQVKEQRRKNAERQARYRASHSVTDGVSNRTPSPTPFINRTTTDKELHSSEVDANGHDELSNLTQRVSDAWGMPR
jgi:hypothetical protein